MSSRAEGAPWLAAFLAFLTVALFGHHEPGVRVAVGILAATAAWVTVATLIVTVSFVARIARRH